MARPSPPAAPVAFPLAVDARGRTALAATPRAVAEQRIEELLLTNPGERLNRPTFGSGLLALVFEPASEELRTATQFQIAAQLQQWLSDDIRVAGVAVAGTGADVAITVSYRLVGVAELLSVTVPR